MERDLDRRFAAAPGQPGRDHLRVVEDEQIARAEQDRQISNPPVLKAPRGWYQQQPGRIARLARVPRDALARQVEIEIVDVHGFPGGDGAPARLASIGGAAQVLLASRNRFRTRRSGMAHRLTRREFGVAAGAAALAAHGFGGTACASDTKTLRFIAQSDLRVLDPVRTTAYITRNHGYMVFDTLFSIDAEFAPHPQMVGDYSVSPDKLAYQFKLRDGLGFHDGSPVRGADCVASVKRWMARYGHGQSIAAVLDDIKADGDNGFTIRLKEPFSLLLDGFAKVSSLAL